MLWMSSQPIHISQQPDSSARSFLDGSANEKRLKQVENTATTPMLPILPLPYPDSSNGNLIMNKGEARIKKRAYQTGKDARPDMNQQRPGNLCHTVCLSHCLHISIFNSIYFLFFLFCLPVTAHLQLVQLAVLTQPAAHAKL